MIEEALPTFLRDLIQAGSAADYQRELDQFKEDVKRHGLAAKLWLHEYRLLWMVYTSKITDYRWFMEDVEPDLKHVYYDYTRLEAGVKNVSAKLYDEEVAASRQEVFGKQRPPKAILGKKSQLLKIPESEIAEELTEKLPTIPPGFTEMLQRVVTSLTKFRKVSENTLKMDDALRSLENETIPDGMQPEEVEEFLKSHLPEFDDALFEDALRELDLPNVDGHFLMQMEEFEGQIRGSSEKLDKTFKKYFDDIVDSFTACIQDIDSLNQHLVRFLARLVHIQRSGNRLYAGIERMDSDQDREELKGFIKSFGRQYPSLGKFLASYFRFNVLRISSAHSNVDTRLTEDGSKIVISRVGKPPLEYEADMLNKKINSYVSLTSVLPIFRDDSKDDHVSAFVDLLEFMVSYLTLGGTLLGEVKRIAEIQTEMDRREADDEKKEKLRRIKELAEVIDAVASGRAPESSFIDFLKKYPEMINMLKKELKLE